MRAIFYLMFGVSFTLVANNQFNIMVGDMTAIMGYAGAALPFLLVGLAYGAGRWDQM